jgi:hypothetical protein
LIGSIAEAEGVAGFELDQPVIALARGVGDAGGHICLDAISPLVDGLGEGDEFGQVGRLAQKFWKRKQAA